MKCTWSSFCKKYLCSENYKFRIIFFWTCVFYYLDIFCKKLKYEIKPNFAKGRIRPPLVIFSAFLKTGSSHFLSPNGQGYFLKREFYSTYLFSKLIATTYWLLKHESMKLFKEISRSAEKPLLWPMIASFMTDDCYAPCCYLKWYFVAKIFLTYSEKKLFLWSSKTFEIRGLKQRICKILSFIQTVKGQNNFW